MSTNPNTASVISLREGFGALVVQGPNIKVEVFDDGNVVVHTGMVKVKSSVSATSSSTASKEALKVGDLMPRSTNTPDAIYGGISKTTNEPFYIAPKNWVSCGGTRPWTSPPAPTRPSRRAKN